MGTSHDPGIGRILLDSDSPSVRILGYALAHDDITYDALREGAVLNGENPVEDSLHRMERGGYLVRNGDGSYHFPRDRFIGIRSRNEGLEILRGRLDGDMDVYDHVDVVLEDDPDAAVPAPYLDERFPDTDWRLELSPFVMAGALRRRNHYDADDLPRLVPGDAAAPGSDADLPLQVYARGDPVYRQAAAEIVAAGLPDDGAERADAARPQEV